MFGKKKEKVHSIKYVVLENGLSNFMDGCVIEILVNETNHCITFCESKKNGATATLSFDKIIKYETDSKIGVVPQFASKGKPQMLQTLKITYRSNDEEKEINLCETNNYGTAPFNLLVILLKANIKLDAPKHIDL